MRLYYHKTDGGAEYLFDTYIKCKDGSREGTLNDKTQYIVRIDGDITKDAELIIKNGQWQWIISIEKRWIKNERTIRKKTKRNMS